MSEYEDKKDLEKSSWLFELWPLDGPYHPINYENFVEEAYYDRLFRIARENN